MIPPTIDGRQTPEADWLARTLFGANEYLRRGVGEWADAPDGSGIYHLGLFSCRKIAGSSSWSDHAFGAALDIGIDPDGGAFGDRIVAYLGTLPFVRYTLWKRPDHFNHVHASVGPKPSGLPTCAGGPASVIVAPWPIDLEDESLNERDRAELAIELCGEAAELRARGKLIGYDGPLPTGAQEFLDAAGTPKFKGLLVAIGRARAAARYDGLA